MKRDGEDGELAGLRVLVVEDEMITAFELEDVLRAQGCIVLGPAKTVERALLVLDHEQPDIALLDIHLGGELVTPVAVELRRRRVPFVLVTVDSRAALGAPDLQEAPCVSKPVSYHGLVKAIAKVARGADDLGTKEDRAQPAFLGDRTLIVASLALLMDNIADELWFCDADGNLVLANRAALRSLGVAKLGEVVQPAASWFSELEIFEGKNRPRLPENAPLLRSLKGEVITGCKEIIRHPITGRMLHREIFSAPIRERDGTIAGSLAVVRDVTERREAEDQLRRLALHDPLTGLPNRTLLHDRLAHALTLARRDSAQIAVMIVDLDHFKDVNDTLGHPAGDQLLRGVADRLKCVLRESDTLARLGGDEFALVQVQVQAATDAARLAGKILGAFALPFQLDEGAVRAAASIGIALFPDDGRDPAALLKNADLALYRAKSEGRSRFRFFEAAMDAEVRARRRMEADLRRALEREEFTLEYQPQYDLASKRFTGVEALLRWRHRRRGLVLPNEFIPMAEASGLIRPLGDWVLQKACLQARTWQERGWHAAVAVNLSPVQLRHKHFGQTVERALRKAELEPARLEFEITEGVLIETLEKGEASCLHDLASHGVALAIDDFGLGYSSLAYLKQLPVGKIKINRSLVRSVGSDPEDDALVGAIVAFGHGLGMRVVAEGVETKRQLSLCRQFGCDQIQGFLLAQPQRPEQLEGIWAHAGPLNW
jgi:diguanylate cyclase (GGDEF)-like protein/PAS domain S-box-containing protein